MRLEEGAPTGARQPLEFTESLVATIVAQAATRSVDGVARVTAGSPVATTAGLALSRIHPGFDPEDADEDEDVVVD